MEQYLKADIFFFITSVAVIALTVLLGIALIYLILISKRIHYILGKAREETDLLSGELAILRSNIRGTGFKIAHLLKFFAHIQKGKNK